MERQIKRPFEKYLGVVRRRERLRLSILGLLCALIAVLLIVAGAAAFGIQRGFTDEFVWLARAALVITVITLLVVVVFKPWRVLGRTKGTELVEQADSAFDGRAETWLNTAEKTKDHPFLDPLAHDAMRVAERVPASRVVRSGSIAWPALATVALLSLGMGFVQYANQTWKNAATHVLFGWANPNLVVNRDISVEPGNVELLVTKEATTLRFFGFPNRLNIVFLQRMSTVMCSPQTSPRQPVYSA